MYTLELAKWEDIPHCVDILSDGREFQREQGFVQWPDGYPGRAEVESDVRTGKGYVIKCGDTIAAYLYIGFDGDPAYPEIRGAWHYPEPYAVIHRMAIGKAFRGKGVSGVLFQLAGEFIRSKGITNLRIDTDEANSRMRHVLEKNGFACCGLVIQGGGDRLAFDKSLN